MGQEFEKLHKSVSNKNQVRCIHQNTPVLKHGPRSHSFLQIAALDVVVQYSSNNEWTRKVVNYSWKGISQGKPWQMTYVILTCNSFILFENRGERPIEPPSSWFLSKFLLGQRTCILGHTQSSNVLRIRGQPPLAQSQTINM